MSSHEPPRESASNDPDTPDSDATTIDHAPGRGATDARSRPTPLGRWGPLELVAKVGEGAFGETFRARDPRLERDVALKLLKSDASKREDIAGRVIREGVLLARVNHANVVTVHGAERHDGRVGVWMEFVQGRTLADVLDERGVFGEHETAIIGLHLCRALAAVHGAGVVHRDIKDANVMREEGGRLVLLDFGAGQDVDRAAKEPSITGTPFYMAPELFDGEPSSVRSDLYSLGILLDHLVTGSFPVEGDRLSDLLAAHETGRYRSLRDARPDVSDAFARVIERCTARQPSARFESAGALGAALSRIVVDTFASAPLDGRGIHAAHDLTRWRRERIAEWSRPRYRLDKEFVSLTLLVDQGEEAMAGRWHAQPARYQDLRALLQAVDDPALVLLGPPGSGKSTLLRRYEMDTARAAIETAVSGEDTDPVTFLLPLNHYAPRRNGGTTEPGTWLEERWHARYPELPAFSALLRQGRLVLLLDALNEMPTSSTGEFRRAVMEWKAFVQRLATDYPGNRVVITCRELDYSAPLSSPTLRVPQVVIEPMTDEQIEQYLVKHDPTLGRTLWQRLSPTPQLEVMRSPFFLSLLLSHVDGTGVLPEGRAELFTGFIRQALKREIERDNPLFAPGELIRDRDVRRVLQWRWRSPTQLPDRGRLVSALTELAFGMQDREGGAAHVRIDVDEALALLGVTHGEEALRAGVALSVLDEDAAGNEVMFVHQLLQEYFAARRFASAPEPERVRSDWRKVAITPRLEDVLQTLAPAEVLPALATTGWEETALLAAAMSPDADAFVRTLAAANLPLAGRCAAQSDVRPRLSQGTLEALRHALVARCRSGEADLRARIAAGLALGPLGDPRFARVGEPNGRVLVPPLVHIPAGSYPIGENEPFENPGQTDTDHMPRHTVDVPAFRIGRFAVTNAEWARFMAAGGYEDVRFWDTEAARRWRSGEETADGDHQRVREGLEFLRQAPDRLDAMRRAGQLTDAQHDQWKRRLAMTVSELDAHIREEYPGGTFREPMFWRNEKGNNPSQPVVGVCWFEARAYCSWLSTQTGLDYRLPTEVEWEAAARGRAARRYAWGDRYDPLCGNTLDTRVKQTTPVGVFVEGDTPEGVSDLTGNVFQWTSSAYGPRPDSSGETFGYPYRADDGRENPTPDASVRRILRGGGWGNDAINARTAFRFGLRPDYRGHYVGLRVLLASSD